MSVFDEDKLATPELLKKYSFWFNESEEANKSMEYLKHIGE